MNMSIDYKIVKGEDALSLARKVTPLMAKGWVPNGGIIETRTFDSKEANEVRLVQVLRRYKLVKTEK